MTLFPPSFIGRVLLAGAVLLPSGLAGHAVHAAAQGPAGAAFYQPPAPLPEGPHGIVVWSRPFAGTMALPSAARNELVLYLSTDAQGRSVPVSGTLAVPKGTPPAGGWPLITWTHGTTGLAPACAPSLDVEGGPEHGYIADIRVLLDRFVAAGYAVAAADYEGLGVPGFNAYLQGVPTGRNALDMARAARALEPAIGARYASMGHSQGGQVDLFTAAQGPAYLPELTVVGDAAFAPGSHFFDRLESVRQSAKADPSLPYVLYMLVSYSGNHPEIELSRILTPEAISHLPELQIGCMSHALTTGYWSTAIARDQFLKEPDLAAFRKVAAENEPKTLAIPVPSLILQGTADVTVPPGDTDALAAALCAKGNVVDYRTYAGTDHDGAMASGAADALDWLTARFAGQPVAGNCAALPKAAK